VKEYRAERTIREQVSLNMAALLVLGFALGLDSLRASLGLGALQLDPARQITIALAFGICDGLALFIGNALGSSIAGLISPYTADLGPLVLGGYGLYLLYVARQSAKQLSADEHPWMILGLPVVLSLDNLVAGIGAGLIGFPILLSATIIGLMSALLSAIGLRFGGALAHYLQLKSELIGGIMLILLAGALALNLI